jgi:redox-sensitive bicupin YhaK (pirin superfamily)
MIQIRKSRQRGHFDYGWLETYHSFSFASYYDRNNMGFRALRVINEDRVKPGEGFANHPHDDMEIISYVIDGALEHKDSKGNGSVVRRGEVQRMSAGTGIMHSEFNHSATDMVHFLQIWILPEEKNLPPSYQQKEYANRLVPNQLCLIASRSGSDDSVVIHQDANIYVCVTYKGNELGYSIPDHRNSWIQIVDGILGVNGNEMHAGDGCAISEERQLAIHSYQDSEFILFDLA